MRARATPNKARRVVAPYADSTSQNRYSWRQNTVGTNGF